MNASIGRHGMDDEKKAYHRGPNFQFPMPDYTSLRQ
jgi:hypothetical protein